MPISLNKIIKNWELLSSGNEYHEQELFTKFEDAFLYECGKGNTGIKIIHHSRSFVSCKEFSRLGYTFGAKNSFCELADIRFLAYSLQEKKTARLLFLQFKEGEQEKSTKKHYAKIDQRQMLLFSKFPMVRYRKDPSMHAVLKDNIHKRPQSGAMFVMIENDSVSKEYNLRFMNYTQLKSKTSKKPMSSKSSKPPKCKKYYYKLSTKKKQPSEVYTTASSSPFKYWDYIPSFEEFLKKVKELEVGREIDITALSAHLPKEALPVDLIEYCNKNNTSITNQINLDNVKGNKSRKLIHPARVTIAINVDMLNVDELVD